MGRKEDRRKQKRIKGRLTQEQYKDMMNAVHVDHAKMIADNMINNFLKDFSESLREEFLKNGLTLAKADMLFEDIMTSMKKKRIGGDKDV